MKPTLGVDLDGVVCDWANPVNRYLAKACGVAPLEVSQWNFNLLYPPCPARTEAWDYVWGRWIRFGLYEDLAEIPMAVKSLHYLSSYFHLHFITHRPENSRDDTLWWLAGKRLDGWPVTLTADKVDTDPQPAVMVEDKPETVRAFQAAGIPVLLFSQPWNVAASDLDPCRVMNWSEVVISLLCFLEGDINQWRKW